MKDGTQRTHQLLGIFTSKSGSSEPRLCHGWLEMGGLIAIRLVETYPGKFSGLASRVRSSGRPSWQGCDYFGNVPRPLQSLLPWHPPRQHHSNIPPDGIDVMSDIVDPAVEAMTARSDGSGHDRRHRTNAGSVRRTVRSLFSPS